MAPKGIELASAYVSLSVNTDGVGREIERFARGIRDIEVDIEANVRPASRKTGKWRAEEEGEAVDIDVDANTKGAAANVSRWRATEQARPIKIRVDADTGRAAREIDALSSNLFKFARSDVFKLNLGAAAITALPALASGLAEVAAGIQQVAQAGLALPGIMAGATSSIGTLVFGLSGIGDAYDAMNKAADDAAKSGGAVASQQRAQMSASFGLRNAIVDEAQAREDVNRAIRDTKRDLQDLNLEMRGGIISEKRAILEAQKARQRLYSGDYTDIRDALLDVEEADQRVAETRARNARTYEELQDANAKGIAGSDKVVAANERLVRSQQGVAQAEAAVAAAAPGATAAQQNADLAMSKLSGNAQEFVNTLMDLQGPIQTLKFLVQDNMFEGLSDGLRDLAGKSMPMLEQGLGGIAKAWNHTFDEIFRVAGEDDTQGILARIFGNTEDAQNILTNAIDPLAEGLLVLSEAGTEALPRLAEGFVGLSERFTAFITKADASGQLDKWINDGITAIGHLGESLLNVGKMFTGITNATSGSFLSNLAQWTNTWQTWINSVEGQNTLRDFFEEGRRVFEQWRPILEDIPGLFKGIYDGASTWIGAVTTVVAPITEFLEDHPGLVKTAAEAYLAFKSAQVLGSIATLGNALGTPGGGKFGKGGVGLLGKLTMIMAAFELIDEFNGGDGSDPVNGGPDFGKQAALAGAGAYAGGKVAGPPGAVVGGVGGAAAAPILDFLNPPGSAKNGVLPGAAGQRNGNGPASVGGIPIPGLRDPAQNTPFEESSAEDTGGRILPQTQYLKDRYTSWGFTDIGGYRPPDKFKEHSSGKAIDVMVPNWQNEAGIAAGTNVALDALMQPNTEYVIWRNEMWYPDGRREPYSGYGNTDDPTKMHMDHVHVKTFDQGGWWKDGELGINTTGQDELVLNPQDLEYLKSNGIDPNSLQHGAARGAPPGPGAAQQGGGSDPFSELIRTGGFIPAAASGNTGVAGTSSLAGFISMGNDVVGGLIDTGANLAKTAASAAITAGSMGGSAAAGPAAGMAAGYGIDLAANTAKRVSSYWFQLAAIGADALVEQAFPFGAPRWIGYDYTSFIPQTGIPQAMVTTGEKALGQMIERGVTGAINPGQHQGSGAAPGPGGPVNPQTMPGMATPLPAPGANPFNADHGGAPQPPGPGAPPPNQAPNPTDPSTWLPFAGVFDQGGVWAPNSVGANLSKKPEYVFTQKQMANMARTAAGAAQSGRSGSNYYVYAENTTQAVRELRRKERLDSMQYSGRP